MWCKQTRNCVIFIMALLLAAGCGGGHDEAGLVPGVGQAPAAAAGNTHVTSITYSVSGHVRDSHTGTGMGGVTLYFDKGAGNAGTDSSGAYTASVAAGVYTVTPVKPYWRFYPVSRRVDVTKGSAVNINFIGTYDQWTVTGLVKQADNSPIGGTRLTLIKSGEVLNTTISDREGKYSFNHVASGDYQITAWRPHWGFTPAYRNFTVNAGDVKYINFFGNNTWVISGYVQDPAQFGIADVTVSVSQGAVTLGTAKTDTQGYYYLPPLLRGTYIVTPSSALYTFTPPERAVTIDAAHVPNISFRGTSSYYIAGLARAKTNQRIANATIKLNGGERSVTTSAEGQYYIGGLAPGTYELSIQQDGMEFVPTTRTVSITNAGVGGINFLGEGRGDWPMVCRDMQSTNRSNLAGPSAGVVLWSLDFPPNYVVESPAVSSDGSVVVCAALQTSNGMGGYTPVETYLYRISPQGAIIWQKQLTPASIASHPVLDCAGNIYLGNYHAYAFNSQGDPLWNNDAVHLLRADDAGTLWCNTGYNDSTSDPYYVTTCDYNGQINWNSGIKGIFHLTPDNQLIVRNLYSISKYTLDGSLIWYMDTSSFESQTGIYIDTITGIVVDDDGSVYGGSYTTDGTWGEDPQAFKLNPDGSIAWYAQGDNYGACTIDHAGNYYYRVGGGIEAFNTDGSIKWPFIPSAYKAVATTDINNNVYLMSNFIYKSLDSTGTERWAIDLQDSSVIYTAIGEGARLYCAVTGAVPRLMAIGES
jgi:hypothetical protein